MVVWNSQGVRMISPEARAVGSRDQTPAVVVLAACVGSKRPWPGSTCRKMRTPGRRLAELGSGAPSVADGPQFRGWPGPVPSHSSSSASIAGSPTWSMANARTRRKKPPSPLAVSAGARRLAREQRCSCCKMSSVGFPTSGTRLGALLVMGALPHAADHYVSYLAGKRARFPWWANLRRPDRASSRSKAVSTSKYHPWGARAVLVAVRIRNVVAERNDST